MGITPAYAGNTTESTMVINSSRDHPRVCGKYYIMVFCALDILGSPPRMREIPIFCVFIACIVGITPAYAGNTIILQWLRMILRDHPRVCGKYLKNPNKIAIFPRLNSKNYLLFKINPLLHTILQNYNLMKETLTILSN